MVFFQKLNKNIFILVFFSKTPQMFLLSILWMQISTPKFRGVFLKIWKNQGKPGFSRSFRQMGQEAIELVVDFEILQKQWENEANRNFRAMNGYGSPPVRRGGPVQKVAFPWEHVENPWKMKGSQLQFCIIPIWCPQQNERLLENERFPGNHQKRW